MSESAATLRENHVARPFGFLDPEFDFRSGMENGVRFELSLLAVIPFRS